MVSAILFGIGITLTTKRRKEKMIYFEIQSQSKERKLGDPRWWGSHKKRYDNGAEAIKHMEEHYAPNESGSRWRVIRVEEIASANMEG
jgi:hypothetical protein